MVSEDLNNSGNVSNWELGRIFVRDGKFDDAHRCFLAEVTLSDSANTLVYNDHGHLLNMMGRYDDAIVKFDSYLSSHPDYASSLFGKGISLIGLNRLDEALYWFDKALESDENHAGAWYYSAIIYATHFNDKSKISIAKERYKKYQNSWEIYINNNDYLNEPFHYLSLEKLHVYYKVSDYFRIIVELLENGKIDDDLAVIQWDFDDIKLFNDISLTDKIVELKRNKNIEYKFKLVGYKKDLIDDLSSRFDGLSIEDKEVLIDLMNYFKGFRLSLKDINSLIREYVFEGERSLDFINENRENIAKSRVKENDGELPESVREDFKKINAENKRLKDENNKLKNKKESLSKENEDLNREIQNQKKASKKRFNQPNSSIEKYDQLIKEIESLIDNFYSDNELLNKMEFYLNDDYKNVSSMNIVTGIYNEDYHEDLKYLKDKYDISEDVLNTLDLAFKNFNEKNFKDASKLFGDINRTKTFSTDELKNYGLFLEATSLSRSDELEKAYKMIEPMIKKHIKENTNLTKELKKAKKEKKEEKVEEIEKKLKVKYPMGWFNFGNICFDYANSQSVKDSKKVFDLAYLCYDCARSSFDNSKVMSDCEFNFKDENSENVFIYKIRRMNSIKKESWLDFVDFKDLQQKINGVSELSASLRKINGNLINIRKSEERWISDLKKLQKENDDDLKELKTSELMDLHQEISDDFIKLESGQKRFSELYDLQLKISDLQLKIKVKKSEQK